MDLIEAEDIKRQQEYTEELYKKDLHNPDNHDGMIIQLEPDILENEVTETKKKLSKLIPYLVFDSERLNVSMDNGQTIYKN